MICKNCGTNMPDGVKFCSSCGTPFFSEPANVGTAVEPDLDATVMAESVDVPAQPAAPVYQTPVTPAQPAAPNYNQAAYKPPVMPANSFASATVKKTSNKKMFAIIGGVIAVILAIVLIVVLADGGSSGGGGGGNGGGSSGVSAAVQQLVEQKQGEKFTNYRSEYTINADGGYYQVFSADSDISGTKNYLVGEVYVSGDQIFNWDFYPETTVEGYESEKNSLIANAESERDSIINDINEFAAQNRGEDNNNHNNSEDINDIVVPSPSDSGVSTEVKDAVKKYISEEYKNEHEMNFSNFKSVYKITEGDAYYQLFTFEISSGGNKGYGVGEAYVYNNWGCSIETLDYEDDKFNIADYANMLEQSAKENEEQIRDALAYGDYDY